ncbi:MAG: PadR family transcriptional regulator [Muribaculum sp.]|nr:PadR family transcriptional regulator [Muribaculum sp.]
MNIDNAKSQMRKGMLEYCVMLLLRREACYTSDIITRLKEAELIVVEGTLYPLLTRLRKDGLLCYEWRESTQGPPRKYYALTAEGEDFLRQLDEVWCSLDNSIRTIKSAETTNNYQFN